MFIIVKDCEAQRDRCINLDHTVQITEHWIFDERTLFLLSDEGDISVDLPLEKVLSFIHYGLENEHGMMDLRKVKKDD